MPPGAALGRANAGARPWRRHPRRHRSATVVAVILADGVGARLWPLSRESRPKPFHALSGGRTVLGETLVRAARVADAPPVVIVAEAHRFLAAEQCREAGVADACIALEPAGRGTAAAVALGAHLALARHGEAQLLVLPSDHVVGEPDAFAAAVAAASAHAASDAGALIAFGVAPRHAETGFGWIEVDPPVDANTAPAALPVRAFVEKPGPEAAAAFLACGRHLWNSGMFVFDARACLGELAAQRPDLAEAVAEAAAHGTVDRDFFRPGAGYADAPPGSFDALVMEKTRRAFVVPAAFAWTDVGSWRALAEGLPRDAAGNRLQGDVLALDVRDSVVHAGAGLVVALGVQGLAIVAADDAVLVAPLDRAGEVREVVARLRAEGRAQAVRHREVFRPWGAFERLGGGGRDQVKRLTLKPAAAISLQRHRHRAEHWVVVRGTGEVTCGDRTFTVNENESAYIPRGAVHRLRNPGPGTLEVIEVQTGDYLGEDDIERLEDDYARRTGCAGDPPGGSGSAS